jgi:probable phosphoglycerate mutase
VVTRPTRLYLVRHGQSLANVTWEFSYRRVDPPLTERGLLQVSATAEYLRTVHVDALYASPMMRAVQTAEIFGLTLGLDYEVVEAFREVNVGELEDLPPSAETWAIHARVHDDWARGAYGSSFPGGEDYHSLSGRAVDALTRIVAERPGQAILVVAHGAIFTAAVDAICPDVNLSELVKRGSTYCGIATLDVWLDGPKLTGTLVAWAGRDHLPIELQGAGPGLGGPPWSTSEPLH